MTEELYVKLRNFIVGLTEEELDKLIAIEKQLIAQDEKKAVAK